MVRDMRALGRSGGQQAGEADRVDDVVRAGLPRQQFIVLRADDDADRDVRRQEIGSAACRGRVCKYVSFSVVAVTLKKKQYDILHASRPYKLCITEYSTFVAYSITNTENDAYTTMNQI